MFTNSICRDFLLYILKDRVTGFCETLQFLTYTKHCPLSIKATHFYPLFYDIHTFP